MLKILAKILLLFSRLIVRRYRPKIIGVTGSVGKTSTKSAICNVLSSRFRVRQSVKSYNNEIGVPLTIIGAESAHRSIIGWIKVFFRAIRLIFWNDAGYPQMLVLEMGADRPGDISYLTLLAPCDVGVLTAIAPVHLEKFKTMENIAVEKRLIITHLRAGGAAILNADDELVIKTNIPDGVAAITYGFSESAKVKGSDLMISRDLMTGISARSRENSSARPDAVHLPGQAGAARVSSIRGISFKITHQGSTVPVFLPDVLGRPAAVSALAGAAVGLYYGLNLVDISNALQKIKLPPGRMRVINGANGATIIDDSYNSSPRAALMALETFMSLPVDASAKRYAVLGDMLELGAYSELGHKEVGYRAAQAGLDVLITVGERARDIGRAARLRGFDPSSLFCFAEAMEATRFLKNNLKAGDIILVKGSQAMRMERIVKEIMAEPERDEELLVRQGPEWR